MGSTEDMCEPSPSRFSRRLWTRSDGLRARATALSALPDGRLAAAGAARRALRLVADRFLREIVLFAADGAGFGAKGAKALPRRVVQLCAATRPFGVRAPEAAAARLVDAARL